MNAQKMNPRPPRTAVRATRPRSPERARARAVSHLGRSRWRRLGFGSPAAPGSRPATASGIQDLDQLAGRVVPGEPQEDLLEPAGVLAAVPPQLGHGAGGDDLPVLDDADAI